MNILRSATALASLVVASSAFAQITVFSNSAAGDNFSNAGTNLAGAALTASLSPNGTGWYYKDVRNQGSVGVDTTYARNGNGSVRFTQTLGAPNLGSQSNIAFLSQGTTAFGNPVATSVFGSLDNLTTWSYDVYRNNASIDVLPFARVYFNRPGTDLFGGLIFDPTANGFAAAADDTWHSVDITAVSLLTPTIGSFVNTFGSQARTLFEWKTLVGEWEIYEFNAGLGRNTNSFDGAIDNYTVGFANADAPSFNFEAVPEPATMSILALAAWIKSRKKAKKA